MSSWFTNLANSLGVDNSEQEDDEEETQKTNNQKEASSNLQNKKENDIKTSSSEDLSRGVKEDLSELTKTLTRRLWGVASFLAPPPSSQPPPVPSVSDWSTWESDKSVSADISEPEISDTARITGIRSDFAEIGGRFKNEISKLSSHKAVSEFSKIASTFLPFGNEVEGGDEDWEEEDLVVGDAVGVTKEVLTFARNIAMHPETWLDFPLADDEDSEDFDLSDTQQEHALAVERLAPRLAALRIEICPGYMSEGCFWKIYFVLLHSRLNKHDAELLSTPQIVEARAMLTQDLQNRTRSQESSGRGTSLSKDSNSPQEEHYSSLSDVPSENMSLKMFVCEPSHILSTTDIETEKHPVVGSDIQIVDKSVVEEEPIVHKNKDIPVNSSSKFLDPNYEEDADDWLEDESSEIVGSFNQNSIPLGNEEDVSFSDLEDDDDDDKITPTSSKAVPVDSSKMESRDWVQLDKSSSNSRGNLPVGAGSIGSEQRHVNDRRGKDRDNKECSEWLSVDEIDVI